MRCVPITTSTAPFAASAMTFFCSAADTNRESIATFTGNGA